MKSKYIIPTLFIVLFLFQWYVPSSMIIEHKEILKNGEIILLKTRPIDPYNPFRGRYVSLYFEENSIQMPADLSEEFSHRPTVFVTFQEGPDGFSLIQDVMLSPPSNEAYVEAIATYFNFNKERDSIKLNLDYPFDKYYAEETTAPKIESYNSFRNEDRIPAVAQIRVLNGQAVIEKLLVEDKPIEEYINLKD